MRTKNFILVLGIVILVSALLILLGPGEQNDLKTIVSQTQVKLKTLQENLRVAEEKKLEIEPKYLSLLGFTQNSFNGTKSNFSVVTYSLYGQLASTILYAQNILSKLPNERLLIYDLGLSDYDVLKLQGFCNNSKGCQVLTFDLSPFPSYILDEKTHAFRPIIIKDALSRSKTILFTENNIRLRGASKNFNDIRKKTESKDHSVIGWFTATKQPVSSQTHPKMFEYFDLKAENFYFVHLVSIDVVFLHHTKFLDEKVMLPWLKCILTPECIHPIGAQSVGCKFNKKPQYRYSGCHAYDVSAFNIVLGQAWDFDDKKYSMNDDGHNLFYVESLEQSTKILEGRRKNMSDTSEHPFSED